MSTLEKKTTSYKFLLDPLYLINSPSSADREYLHYLILAAKQKYKSELNKENLQIFCELFINYFNLSTISSLNLIFDKKTTVHGIINEKNEKFFINGKDNKNNKVLVDIIHTLKYPGSEREELLQTYDWIKRKLKALLLNSIETHIKYHGNLKISIKNKQIHKEREIYVFCKSQPSFLCELWRIKDDVRKPFMTNIEFIDTIKEEIVTDSDKLNKYISSINQNSKKINAINNVMVITSERSIDYSEVIYIIRDILFLNKNLEDLFEVKEFDSDILYMVLEYLQNGGL